MKKIISLMGLGLLLATTANADFARVEAGAGVWNYKATGEMVYTDSTGTLTNTTNGDAQSSAYVWLLVKHPIPILPNIRLEYSTIHDDGKGSGTYDSITFPADTPTTTDLTEYDIIPYYNILDNTFWTTVDVGVDLKVVDYDFTAKALTTSPSSTFQYPVLTKDYNKKGSSVIPLAYLRTRVEIPVTDIGLEADAKFISYDGDTVYDARAKVDYTLGFVPVVQPAIEVGYRVQKYDFKNKDKTFHMNMDFKGVYMGLMARF